MKFSNKYEEYMEGHGQKKIPGMGFKTLKSILERCREQLGLRSSFTVDVVVDDDYDKDGQADQITSCGASRDVSSTCQAYKEIFFPSLVKEMTEVVEFFNERGKKLVKQHQASLLSKSLVWFARKVGRKQVPLLQQGRDLVLYAIINAIAMRKILNKFDKIDTSKQGQALKAQVQSLCTKILHSPWLYELMALQINLSDSKSKDSSKVPIVVCDGYSLAFDDEKPSLACELLDSFKLDIDLTCPICLETLFDPICLNCGHTFCYFCACKAAVLSIVEGLKAAHRNNKCPTCRQDGVYKGFVHLKELHLLISRRCPEYWKQRRNSEKAERVQQVKEFWESQTRLFVGP